MTKTAKRSMRRWALAGILLLAFGLRIYRLGAQSLWYDETVSLYLAGQSVPDLVTHTAGDIHPPGYYLLLHGWTRLAGDSEFAAAYFSLFFGLLLVILAGRLGTRTFGYRAGWLAAFLVALSPYNLWYSQEVRMYTLGAALGVGVLEAALSLLARATRGFQPSSDPESPALGALIVYVLCGALGLWTLYYFAFLLVALNLMVGVYWLAARSKRQMRRGWLGRWALAQGAVLLLYAPWLPVAWRQATQPPVPPWRGFTGLGQVLVETWSALSLGQSAQPQKVWPVLLLFVVLFGFGLASVLRRARPGTAPIWQGEDEPGMSGVLPFVPWFLAGAVFIPVLLIYLASFLTPLFHVRYVFTYSLPFYVLVGAGLGWFVRPPRSGALGWLRGPFLGLSLAAIVGFCGLSMVAYHTDPRYASDDHRAAVQYLAEQWRPGDAILVDAGYAYTALVAYWDGDPIAWRGRLSEDYGAAGPGPVVVQTGSVDGGPSLGWSDPHSDFYTISQARTADALAHLFADFDRVWVYRIYDTVTDPSGFIRNWLAQHGTQFEDQVFTGESQLRVQGFLTGREPLAGAPQPVDAALADGSLWLTASSVLPSRVAVGGALDLALVWQVNSPLQDQAVLFAGLFDAGGQLWAQTDVHPLGNLMPVSSWPSEAPVRTPLRLRVPPGTPPGRYRLEVGWYSLAAGDVLWQPWASGQRLALGEVEVVPPADWWALPVPQVRQSVGVTVGSDVRLVGLTAGAIAGVPGDTLEFDLVWQALADRPEAGLIVLQLSDDQGRLMTEVTSAPADGQVPFARMGAGQAVTDHERLILPGDLQPGVYNLSVGRRRADGSWLPIERGFFSLSSTYPLATIRVLGRAVALNPPTVQHSVDARLADSIRLMGFDLQEEGSILKPLRTLRLTLYWQALTPLSARYKIFVHLVGEGGAGDIRAQADIWPHLPTTAWVSGEYLSDGLQLDLPQDLPAGSYTLLMGLYDEATGARLPVFDAQGAMLDDSLPLTQIHIGE